MLRKPLSLLLLFTIALAGCLPQAGEGTPASLPATPTVSPTPIPLPTRTTFAPGALVDYTAQTGDTLPALAARFNTTTGEILKANPEIPASVTTMPPGMPMKIPVYYRPFWGTPFQILPDSLYVNGPAAVGFDTAAFVSSHGGWLKDFSAYAVNATHSGAEIVDIVATNYSISPRVLLALLEYQTGALSKPVPPQGSYILGEVNIAYAGFYMQLIWAANNLNNGYYGWRTGSLTELELVNGVVERPDPWQTAASVGFQYYFSRHFSPSEYIRAIGQEGVARTYRDLFGDPWAADQPHIPVDLQQPKLTLPFKVGSTWTLTSGPHTAWGTLMPLAALDFGPPDVQRGCMPTIELALAIADGVVARSETGVVILDLDGDGDERTGWDILYLHVATAGRASAGRKLNTGDPVGYPSCEGGTATGTHIHVARKYNGEWIPVDSVIAFNMEGWIAFTGANPRAGTLRRGTQTVIACDCSDQASQITAGK